MEKVVCIVCHAEGYTASPQHVKCECGGALIIYDNVKYENKTNKRGGNENPAYIKQNAV